MSLRGHALLTADSSVHGLSRDRLRGPDIAHPFHGVSAVDLDTATVLGRCRAVEPRLFDRQWFSHVTALSLFGAPLPYELDIEPLHLAVASPRTPPRARGICGHTLALDAFTPSFRLGFPVVSPADAWVQSSTLLCREDLVAAGDFLITGGRSGSARESALAELSELSDAVRRYRGRRGSAAARWALPRLRFGPGSRPETRLRLLLVGARLPEPAIQHPIQVAGGRVLHPDLVLVAAKVILEYEGDVHRVDRATWLDDLERRELFEDAGWRVVRVTARDLFEHPEVLLDRVRRLVSARSSL
jgi:very-short-patch-repair endonuclease